MALQSQISSFRPHLVPAKGQRQHEREFALEVETAYRRLVADWQPGRPTNGAGATRAVSLRLKASNTRLTTSTFPRDIAYLRSSARRSAAAPAWSMSV